MKGSENDAELREKQKYAKNSQFSRNLCIFCLLLQNLFYHETHQRKTLIFFHMNVRQKNANFFAENAKFSPNDFPISLATLNTAYS